MPESSGYDELRRATHEAFLNPQVGDRFQEMYGFWMYVLDVQPNDGPVTVMEASAPCTLPEGGKIVVFDRAEDFRLKYAYKSIPGYWVLLENRGNNVAGWLEACRG